MYNPAINIFMKQIKEYIRPEFAMLYIAAECGFAHSIEDPTEKPEIDW